MSIFLYFSCVFCRQTLQKDYTTFVDNLRIGPYNVEQSLALPLFFIKKTVGKTDILTVIKTLAFVKLLMKLVQLIRKSFLIIRQVAHNSHMIVTVT